MMANKQENSGLVQTRFISTELAVVICTVLLVAARVLLLQQRWISPDEGSYLMDARLILDRKIPIADYPARQPIFLYALALLLKIFGTSYMVGKFMSLLSSVGIALLIFFVSRKIFSKGVAVVACAGFLFYPYSIIWSLTLVTEITTIFFALASIFMLIKAVRNEQRIWMFVLSGILASIAFYVRQTAIWVPAALLLYVLFMRNISIKEKIRGTIWFLAGYVAVCVIVCLLFLQALGLQQLLVSRLNPLGILILGLFPKLGATWSGSPLMQESTHSVAFTSYYFKEVLNFSVFLWTGTLLAFWYLFIKKENKDVTSNVGVVVLINWIIFVVFLYIYRTYQRAFFAHYFLEALPPLIIFFSYGFVKLIKSIKEDTKYIYRVALILLLIFWGIYAVQHKFFWIELGSDIIFVLSSAAVVCLLFVTFYKKNGFVFSNAAILGAAVIVVACSRLGSFIGLPGNTGFYFGLVICGGALWFFWKRSPFVLPIKISQLLCTLILTFTIFYSGVKMGQKLGLNNDCIWPTSTLTKITELISREKETRPVILAGTTLWAFQAQADCFMDMTHPTGFLNISQEEFREQFTSAPPDYVILDGYTEKKLQLHLDFLMKKLQQQYENITEIQGARYPVRVYTLRDENELMIDTER